jgi:tetratricopeptide (TPR) repeat protein
MRATNYELRGDRDRALADFSQALLLDPQNVAARDNRGVIWEAKGNLDQALLDFNAAIQLDPDFPPAFRHRARIFEHRGDLEKAEADLNDFVRFSESQDRALALIIRAGFHARHDAVAMAQADLAEALLALDHKRAEPLKEVAWFLATSSRSELRNGAAASELARQACELTGFTNAAMLDVLAATYAESGQFEKAAETEQRAVALTDDAKQRAVFQERIEHYAHNELRTDF